MYGGIVIEKFKKAPAEANTFYISCYYDFNESLKKNLDLRKGKNIVDNLQINK
jgi:hypothetical protein